MDYEPFEKLFWGSMTAWIPLSLAPILLFLGMQNSPGFRYVSEETSLLILYIAGILVLSIPVVFAVPGFVLIIYLLAGAPEPGKSRAAYDSGSSSTWESSSSSSLDSDWEREQEAERDRADEERRIREAEDRERTQSIYWSNSGASG